MNGPFNDQGPTGWKPNQRVPDFKPITVGAAMPASINNDTLVDIAKKLEQIIELLKTQVRIME
jgi:hypothetical protein